MANVANNLLMLGLIYYRRKLFEIQAFHNQAHIINFTGIIIYFCGTYYLYAPPRTPNLRFGRFLQLGGSKWTEIMLYKQGVPLRRSGHLTCLYLARNKI